MGRSNPSSALAVSAFIVFALVVAHLVSSPQSDISRTQSALAQSACIEGDANGDEKVTLVDYQVWRRVYMTGSPTPTIAPQLSPTETDAPQIQVLAQNLENVWAMAFLPDGNILFTERAGRVRLLENGQVVAAPVATISDAVQIEEGGLMGIALHPQFATNGFVYLYYTYGTNADDAKNRLIRMKYANKQLTDRTVIIDAVPATAIHKGGRIKFGPDGFLYITAGDTNTPSLAQNTGSLAGKILRVTDNGDPAPGNPFGNRTYSYGHRNPQGIAWDAGGQLWETEHGEVALDEVNKIVMGSNYGWPTIRGTQTQTGMVTPALNSGDDTWAPSGTAIIGNTMYFGGLRGEALYKVTLPGATNLQTFFKNGDPGRIREVIVGPDGMLYISTTNTGNIVRPNGDKIYRVNPNKL